MINTHLGMFEVTSGDLIISDPSNGCNESFKEWVANDNILSVGVKNGFWSAKMKIGERNLEGRVATLVVHTGELVNDDDEDWLAFEKLFVSSGQAGIFDFSRYQNDKGLVYDETLSNFNNCTLFYQNCSAIILDKPYGGVIKNGVVTSASNGMYTIYVQRSGSLVTAIKIVYIEDELADKLQEESDKDVSSFVLKWDVFFTGVNAFLKLEDVEQEDLEYLLTATANYEEHKMNPMSYIPPFGTTMEAYLEDVEEKYSEIFHRTYMKNHKQG